MSYALIYLAAVLLLPAILIWFAVQWIRYALGNKTVFDY